MAKRSPHMTSDNAANSFKSKISESLPLLGFLNNSDKTDIWRFWKTISSAVKIAVNGRGDIVEAPQRKGRLKREKQLEKYRLHSLDTAAITIYVPVKCSEENTRRFRILKLVNQQKIADYFETIHTEGEGSNSELVTNDNSFDFSEFSELCNASCTLTDSGDKMIVDHVSCAEGEGQETDEDLKVVSSFLQANEKLQDPSSLRDSCSESLPPRHSSSLRDSCSESLPPRYSSSLRDSCSESLPPRHSSSPRDSCSESLPSKLEKSKPIKKIWPVGRPTTRSSSGARVIKDKLPECDVKNSSAKESTVYTSIDVSTDLKVHIGNSDLTVESMTYYPNIKQESQEETEDFITIIPVGDSVMHVTHSFTSSLEQQQEDSHLASGLHADLAVVKSEQCSTSSDEIYPHQILPDKTLGYSVHLSLPLDQSDPQAPEMPKDVKTLGYSVHLSLPLDQSDPQATEIHKECSLQSQTGNEVRQEFVSPTDLSLQCVATQCGETQCVATDEICKQDLAQGQLMSRNASDIETIISALEEELKKTGSEITSLSLASAHDGVEDVPSSAGEVSMEDMPASYVDHSGQTVQILGSQEIVEVQHVDSVIWASEGEVQILEPGQMLSEAGPEEGVVYEGQPVHAQYDVVEYEVLTDKKHKRGRKRKFRDESTTEKAALVDRTCPMCHRVLNYASSMTAHMRIHTGVRPYSCGQCDRKFTTKANRDRHEATHVGLKPFQCTQCSKSFTEKRSLKIHMRTHTGERPFVCDVCGQSFTQKCTLLVHMDRHTNKKRHLCDLCGKAFRQKCQLDVHVKRHKRQALYPCPECSTKCYTKGDLVRHMIKHTGERPFRCKLCPRAFTRKQYLVDHENQHYGRKPYRCSVCSATFHDMGSCHRHLKKHKVDNDEDSSKSPTHSALLSSSDFHRILEGTQIGQILKLDDGSDAIVKAVVSEADGSTVYHITCLGKSDREANKVPDEPVEQVDSISISDSASAADTTNEKLLVP